MITFSLFYIKSVKFCDRFQAMLWACNSEFASHRNFMWHCRYSLCNASAFSLSLPNLYELQTLKVSYYCKSVFYWSGGLLQYSEQTLLLFVFLLVSPKILHQALSERRGWRCRQFTVMFVEMVYVCSVLCCEIWNTSDRMRLVTGFLRY